MAGLYPVGFSFESDAQTNAAVLNSLGFTAHAYPNDSFSASRYEQSGDEKQCVTDTVISIISTQDLTRWNNEFRPLEMPSLVPRGSGLVGQHYIHRVLHRELDIDPDTGWRYRRSSYNTCAHLVIDDKCIQYAGIQIIKSEVVRYDYGAVFVDGRCYLARSVGGYNELVIVDLETETAALYIDGKKVKSYLFFYGIGEFPEELLDDMRMNCLVNYSSEIRDAIQLRDAIILSAGYSFKNSLDNRKRFYDS